jgi:transcriptional regulator with XRE-family HTH domain
MTPSEFVAYLRSQVQQCGEQKKYAALLGISPAYLNDVLNGSREPGRKILDGAGFERVVSYKRKDNQSCN